VTVLIKGENVEGMTERADLEKMQREDHDALIRVEAKIDNFISSQADHEVRLRSLENTFGTIKGLKWSIGIIGTILVLATPFIIYFMSKP